jgi:hypothetical protein
MTGCGVQPDGVVWGEVTMGIWAMDERCSVQVWVLLASLVISACVSRGTLPKPTASGIGFDEESFFEDLPRPEDAQSVEVGEGYDLGFASGMIEPELFDFYATWLQEHGWRQQAPTEAMITLPHQVWRKDGTELLIEIQGLDEGGHTVVWLQLEEQ